MPYDDEAPKIYGISLKLTPLEGPGGPFKIAYAGSRQESDDGYFYQDDHDRFGFYAEIRGSSWNVNYASTGAWEGVPFRTTPHNEAIFRQNIEFFFQTRRWTDPARPGDASTIGIPVTFSWDIDITRHEPPLELTPLEGPGGPFKIAYAGRRTKESDDGYLYQDDHGRFGFYAEMRTTPAKSWNVNYASDGAWVGRPFRTSPQSEAIFRQNIEFFFQTRDWLDPAKPGDASTIGVPVTFSWDVVRREPHLSD